MSLIILVASILAFGFATAEMPLTASRVTPGTPGHIQLTNTGSQAATAWAVAVSTTTGDRTHREVTTTDGYLSEATHGLPGAAERLERLAPGQSREIAFDALAAGAHVEVIAVVLDDGTAIGDEPVIASIFAHRVKERDALGAVVASFKEVLASKQGPEALAALRERFTALAQRDDSIPCHAALDAVQNYSQSKTNVDDINTALQSYAAFVSKEFDLAVKHAVRRS